MVSEHWEQEHEKERQDTHDHSKCKQALADDDIGGTVALIAVMFAFFLDKHSTGIRNFLSAVRTSCQDSIWHWKHPFLKNRLAVYSAQGRAYRRGVYIIPCLNVPKAAESVLSERRGHCKSVVGDWIFFYWSMSIIAHKSNLFFL